MRADTDIVRCKQRYTDRRPVEVVAAWPVGDNASIVDCRDPADPGWGVVRFGAGRIAAVGDRPDAAFELPTRAYPGGHWILLDPAPVGSTKAEASVP